MVIVCFKIMKLLCVVFSFKNEEDNLEELADRTVKFINELKDQDYKLILTKIAYNVIGFFSGNILISLGFVGIYIGKIFNQTKNTHRYIIKETK